MKVKLIYKSGLALKGQYIENDILEETLQEIEHFKIECFYFNLFTMNKTYLIPFDNIFSIRIQDLKETYITNFIKEHGLRKLFLKVHLVGDEVIEYNTLSFYHQYNNLICLHENNQNELIILPRKEIKYLEILEKECDNIGINTTITENNE